MKGCITITNHTDVVIDIVSIQDNSVATGDRRKVHSIEPKNSCVLFTDRVEALSWDKPKK